VVNDEPSPELARIALRNRWPFLRHQFAKQALAEIRTKAPEVVVVQVSLGLGEDLRLIQLVQCGLLQASLIGVASAHHAEIELAVRMAGATGYFPDASDAGLIERMVNDLLARSTGGQRTSGPAGRARQSKNNLFLPPVPTPGRRVQPARRPPGRSHRSATGT
jgi:DNA-binding NarL/FixJ family response regulator